MMKTSAQRPPVSASARQRKGKWPDCASQSPVVAKALRDLEKKAIVWPRALNPSTRIRTSYDHLSTAYRRCVVGSELLDDTLIRAEEHLLIVVESGDILLESAQRPAVVHRGGSALVPTGLIRLSEMPEPGCELRYWMIFFGPGLLYDLLHTDRMAEEMAMRVAPVFSGVYVQTNILSMLDANELATPACNVKSTFKALLIIASASVYMFLRDHFYIPQFCLKELSFAGPQEIEKNFRGGIKAFRKAFKAYHGIPVETWQKRQGKSKRKVGSKCEGSPASRRAS